jgi:hypothetical protein
MTIFILNKTKKLKFILLKIHKYIQVSLFITKTQKIRHFN